MVPTTAATPHVASAHAASAHASPHAASPHAASRDDRPDTTSATGSAAGSSTRVPRTRSSRARTARAKPDRRARASSSSERKEGRVVAAGSAPTADPGDGSAPLRVLFIGNSHTHRFGGMEWLVSNLVRSEDPPRSIDAERLTASGVTLEYHYEHDALQAIRDGDWDVVVLQEYLPGITSRSAEPFSTYAGLLDKAIRASGARTVLYMTWPETAHPWADMDDMVSAFQRVGGEIGAPVAPVGVAMERAEAERPGLEFLGPDEVHTTWEGAYLAAATIYATLFERSPQGLAYHLGISDEDAAFLQRVAWETARDWQAATGHPYAESGTLTLASADALAVGEHPTANDEQATASDEQPTS